MSNPIQNLKAFAKAIPQKLMAALAPTKVQMVNANTIRIDLPDGKANDGINRIRLTRREDGTVDVQLIQITEIDLIGGVPLENLASTIEAFTGIKASV